MRKNAKSILVFIAVIACTACDGPVGTQTHVYELVEETFTAENTYNNAYMDVDLWVNLNGPDGLTYRIPAFWDGDQTFRVRMVATAPGTWHWSTGASTGDSGLDNKTGSINATAWTEVEKEENPNRRGFLRVSAKRRTFEYADGTPFFFTADTWWCALTRIYSWDSSEGLSGFSFQEGIALRKAQGFNAIEFLACYPSDSLSGIWHASTHGEKVAEDGATPFVIADPSDKHYGVDYTQINPGYWQQADRKMEYMSDQGFAPLMETLRRSERWYLENEVERKAFVNYTRYLWARYGCYNMIYSWIHCEGDPNVNIPAWQPMVTMAYEALGEMPYGQPRTAMGRVTSLNWFSIPDVPVSPDAFDVHNVNCAYRDYRMFDLLRDIHDTSPKTPAINIEGFYPDYTDPATGLDNNSMSQFMMYGSVLNGGFAGHAWGDAYWSGVHHKENDPHVNGLNRWNASTMGHLKKFMLDSGHDYGALTPATLTHQVDTEQEFRVLALNSDRSVGLGFIAANHIKTDLIHLIPNAEYKLEWYNIDAGVWSSAITVTTDRTGRLIMPNKPNTKGWAFRIKHNLNN